LEEKFRAQAEQLQKLDQDLKEFREKHEQLESEAWRQFEALKKSQLPSLPTPVDALLAAVRNLLTATSSNQVLDKLTEVASRLGVRAVAFEVRGKAAWGAFAHGFEPQLTEQDLHSLVVPLGVDTPFRQASEIGGHFEGNAELLKKNANVLNRLKPGPDDMILLLPVHSAGAVCGIFYTDSGGREVSLPEAALHLLAEYASAQLDRLLASSGRAMAPAVRDAGGVEPESAVGLAPPAGVSELPGELSEAFASGGQTSAASGDASLPASPVSGSMEAGAPTSGQAGSLAEGGATGSATPAEPAGAPVRAPGPGFDISQLSEAEQKAHKDARRFAKILVSDIELYNKAKLDEGRKNKDLYSRIKLDIDRSRLAFEQRFGKTVGKQFDYFHDELVRTLAGNDPSLLGPEYPGPSV